jgi:hypothetical protein
VQTNRAREVSKARLRRHANPPKPRQAPFLGTALVLSTVLLAGCPPEQVEGFRQLVRGVDGQEVTVNTGDPSPPVAVHLETVGLAGGDVTANLGDHQTIDVAKQDAVLVYASAEDPDGIKVVELWGTERRTCEDPNTNIAQTSGPGLAGGPIDMEPISLPSPSPTQMTFTRAYLSRVAQASECPSQYPRLVSAELQFWAVGRNWADATAGSAAQGPELVIRFS